MGDGRATRVSASKDGGSGVFRAMARRLSWGLADQAVSSITNFAVGIYVARSLGLTAFGIFSLAWVTYGVVLNVSRGLATDPLVVRFSGVAIDSWRDAVARSSGIALGVGVAAGAVSVLAGIGLGGRLGAAFIALGVVLPALMLQDSWRFAFFAAGQGRRAFVNDVVWAAALIPAMIIAARYGSVVAFVLAWGLSGAIAAVYGCIQIGIWPHVLGGRRWLRQQRDLGPRYLIENVSNSGGAQVRMYGLGAIAGLADVGTVRGAELMQGPFLALLMGLCLVTVAEAARVLRRSPNRLWLFCLSIAVGQALAALVWGLILLFLVSDAIGQFLLGSVWQSASTLIVPTTLAVMGISFSTGAAAGLRALGAARRSLRSQLYASAAYVTFGLAGAAMNGALGSSWGVAFATLLGAAVWWIELRHGLREHTSSPATDAIKSDPDPAPETSRRGRNEDAMTRIPRLSIGLPVYNGEEYLAEALEALLGQSYEDFELIISDNASTDSTAEICRRYLKQDSRIRYLRLPKNIGAAPNHNFVFQQSRGELFKWASHDDLYGRDLLQRCIAALDAHPHVVLSHAWLAIIDSAGGVTRTFDYKLATDSLHAPDRFRSLLFAEGGDDFYGVIRSDVLRRVAPHDSYHHADRTIVAEIAMHGPFYQVPELLYFRRDHPTRAERANPTIRSRCANLDPRRANPLRYPTVRLLTDYVWGFVEVIRRAPLSPAERRECYRYLAQWLVSRAGPETNHRVERQPEAAFNELSSVVDSIVPGRQRRVR